MYVEHPYKFNDKFYAKIDGKFYEITREVAKAMLSAYRNEVYRSKKWQPEDPETMTRKTKLSEHEQFIIKSIYFDGMKQVELAKKLEISKVRMSQKVSAILKKMRKMYEIG